MKKRVWIILITLLFCAVLLSIFVGGSNIPIREVIKALFNNSENTSIASIIWQVRIPRSILAILVGASLAVCGCVMQGMLRNPLAEPYTLGISGGAALGVMIVSFFSIGFAARSGAAFIGAVLAGALVFMTAQRRSLTVLNLVLAGIMVTILTSSIILFLTALSNSGNLHMTMLWLMGDISISNYKNLLALSILMISGVLFLIYFGRDVDILSLGEDKAKQLGVSSSRIIKILFLGITILTAFSVAFAGVISFVGIVVPHVMRKIVGPKHRALITAAAFAGAIYVLTADVFARLVLYPVQLPLGVVTGIIGSIFFLVIITKKGIRSYGR
ncbi:MAG: iron ABC transporter permease [Elusimicrobiota bacterium]